MSLGNTAANLLINVYAPLCRGDNISLDYGLVRPVELAYLAGLLEDGEYSFHSIREYIKSLWSERRERIESVFMLPIDRVVAGLEAGISFKINLKNLYLVSPELVQRVKGDDNGT